MAPPKRLRPAPLDDPPTASSSSSDDDLPPPKNQEDEVVDEEEEDSSEEGEEENDEDEDEDEGSSSEEEEVQPTPPSQLASKNPPPSTPISNPKPESASESESESGSGSESGSDSDSEPEPTPSPNAKVKPLASKPMKTQPQAQSTPIPARSGTKRANENGSTRAKKKTTAAGGGSNDENDEDVDGDVKMSGEDSKKIHQRIFTEEDEIAILKGLAEFISKTGKDPMKDPSAFHSFVKKSIHADANSEQLKRKVRGLKMKFSSSGSFTREHDKKAFELSKKVWGNNGANEAEENGKVNEKTPKSTKKEAPIRNNGSTKKEVVTKKGTGKYESDVDKSLAFSEMSSFGDAAGLSLLNKDAMRRGMELMGESKVDEFDARWRKVQIAEMEVFVARGQLIKDQTRMALEAYKKSIN